METPWKKLALPKYSLAAPKIWVAQNLGGGGGVGGVKAAINTKQERKKFLSLACLEIR